MTPAEARGKRQWPPGGWAYCKSTGVFHESEPRSNHYQSCRESAPPDDLIEANRLREQSPAPDEHAFQELLQRSVADIARKQKEVGVYVPNNGEFGISMG